MASAHRSESSDNLCARCGDFIPPESVRMAAAMGVTECAACRLAPPAFTRAVSFAPYDAELRELLHLLKFEGQRPLATHLLGASLAAAMLKLRTEAANDVVVVPVPLFTNRERTRGFNQALLLAQAAIAQLRRDARDWKLTLKQALVRTRDTKAMFALSPHARRESLRGAFRIADEAAVRGKEVLLIDDIMTTGATARECARVLLRAGAAKVWVVTVARASLETPATHHNVAFWRPTGTVEPDSRRMQSF